MLAAAALSSAVTPAGFQPAAQADLLVLYGNLAAVGGLVVARDCESRRIAERAQTES